MSFIDTDTKRKRIQFQLSEHLDATGMPYYRGVIDGILGDASADAIVRFRKDHNIVYPPHPAEVDTDLMRELGLLTIQDPAIVGIAKAKGIDLISLLKLIGLANRLSKGDTTMTADQIGGVIRAILTFLAGIAVAKGWLDNATALTIVGALVTLATAAWSIFTNRPANIASK
jgi:hypothetical protein